MCSNYNKKKSLMICLFDSNLTLNKFFLFVPIRTKLQHVCFIEIAVVLVYFPLCFFCFRGFSTTKIVFYYGTNGDLRITYDLEEASSIPANQNFNSSKNTLLYAHGWTENQKAESIRTLVQAYSRRGDHNLLILDWADLAAGNYLTNALPNVSKLGQRLAGVIKAMLDGGLRVESLHLVGHSLGAHLVGSAGREIQRYVVLPRITGLDPAFPGFYIIPLEKPLTLGDAKFVDIIHTDAYVYGTPFARGHVDFWPNGGTRLQPGCKPQRQTDLLSENSFCSHWKSWRFWAESVSQEYKETFLAIKAKSWKHFQRGIGLNVEDVTLMGIDCSVTARGNYYLTTNESPPFARSTKGLNILSQRELYINPGF